MEEKKRPGAESVPEGNKNTVSEESFIKNPEADTEGIVDFMHEEIRKRPVNRKRLLRRAQETMVVAVVFGVVSCVVFALFLPVINNLQYPGPGEETAKNLSLPEEKPSEELSPQDLVEKEKNREASEEREWISRELDSILDEKIVGIEQQKRISASLQELAQKNAGMIAQVSVIKSDKDWFNDSYEDRNTVSGLVTKKDGNFIYVLVQGRRILDAKKIMVTFSGGAEAEAQVAGRDDTTGFSVLSVPVAAVPAESRELIQEASLGTSAGSIITGAPVIAMGSPTGTAGSVIYGNVTGADEKLEIRDNDLSRITTDIYGSTDATGVLINLDGAVVGVLDMRYKDGNIPNMLCAIGISELRPVLRRLEKGETKAYLGISGIDVSESISQANNIPVGVWVNHVEEDSPAMDAGIQKGDVIVGFGNVDILHMAGLVVQLETAEPGQDAQLRICRQNGGNFEEMKLTVSLQ